MKCMTGHDKDKFFVHLSAFYMLLILIDGEKISFIGIVTHVINSLLHYLSNNIIKPLVKALIR